jgi:hypothetical protein
MKSKDIGVELRITGNETAKKLRLKGLYCENPRSIQAKSIQKKTKKIARRQNIIAYLSLCKILQ